MIMISLLFVHVFLFLFSREETYRIVHMPFPYATRDLSEENPISEMGYAGGAIKRKVDGMKRERHRGKGGRKDVGECKGRAAAKKRHRGRHCRCRRRRLECRRTGKVLPWNVSRHNLLYSSLTPCLLFAPYNRLIVVTQLNLSRYLWSGLGILFFKSRVPLTLFVTYWKKVTRYYYRQACTKLSIGDEGSFKKLVNSSSSNL